MSTHRTTSKLWQGVMAQGLKPAAGAPDGAFAATKNARLVRRGFLFAGVGTTGLMVSLGALAQDVTNSSSSPNAAQSPEPAANEAPTLSTVTVTGFRKSYADALNIKRETVEITDSISEDGLGRFPDLNVGEALARLPGVQINREAGSRDATINLRGLPGTYVEYTINGQAYATPILDSSTPLGAFNADVFSAISVIKTPSAAVQAGGLSGNIDLQIAPALERKDGGFFKIAGEYDTLGSYKSPAYTLGYNQHITDTFAVFGVAAYQREIFRRDSIFYNAYSPLNPATTPNFASLYSAYYSPYNANGSCPSGPVCAPTGTGALGKNGVLFASDIRQTVKYNDGNLKTFAGGMQWKATDELKFGVLGFYTERNLGNNSTDLLEGDMRSTLATISPTSAPVRQGDGNYYVQGFNYANVQLIDSFRLEPLLERAWDVDGTVEWESPKWHLTGTAVSSKGTNNALQTQIDLRQLPTAAGNGISGAFNSGGASLSNYVFNMNTPTPVGAPAGPWTWGGVNNQPTQIAANGNQLVVAGASEYGSNELNAGQFDVQRFLDGGIFSSVQAGVRVEKDSYISQGYRTSAQGVQAQNVNSQFLVPDPFTSSFFGGAGGSYLTSWQRLNYNYAVSQLQPVTVPPGATLTPTGWINDPTNSSYSLYNFTVHDDIYAAYLLGNLSFNVLGVRVRGNAGLHFELTREVIDTLNKEVSTSGAITYVPFTFKQNYHEPLPSLLLVADLRDDLMFRFAYYRTFVRPQPRNLTPSTAVSSTAGGFAISYGGYNLKPYSADNIDLALEWYNRPNGLFAIGLFQKSIHDLIAPISSVGQLCPPDATAFGLGHLTVSGTTCYSDILLNGQPAVISAAGNENVPGTITDRGVEVTVQQNLDFLPGLWKNLGGQVNYTLSAVSGQYPGPLGPVPAVLPGVSRNDINLITYYETNKWGVRVIYGWRDQYTLTGGTTFTGGQSLVGARGQVDLAFSYHITDHFSLSLDAYNLTDAVRTQYQVSPGVPREYDYDGRTFTAALHGTF
jgi:TonB-dependent receptor